ncbi:MAG: GtrA family protein [Paludibacter sp.]|nr:GtrA family protein [Paludibacter sp.]
MGTESLLKKIKIFAKAQISAFLGGIVDYSVMIFCTEVFHIFYVYSIGISGVVGAIVNFALNKTWTFRSKDRSYKHSMNVQLLKFILVVAGSIMLKSGGTYCVTTYLSIDYKISRLIVDLFVSLLFNFNMQKYWVFAKKQVAA